VNAVFFSILGAIAVLMIGPHYCSSRQIGANECMVEMIFFVKSYSSSLCVKFIHEV